MRYLHNIFSYHFLDDIFHATIDYDSTSLWFDGALETEPRRIALRKHFRMNFSSLILMLLDFFFMFRLASGKGET